MEDLSKIETEFDIIGFFKYCIKKWIIIAVAVVLGASAFFVIKYDKEGAAKESYEAGANFYSILQFLSDNKDIINADSSAAESVYTLTSRKAIGYMGSEELKEKFLKKQEVRNDMRVIFSSRVYPENYDFKSEFAANVTMDIGSYEFRIRLTAALNTEKKVESAKRILDSYVEDAMLYASTHIEISQGALEKVVAAKVIEEVEEASGGLVFTAIISIAFGVIIGFIAIVATYIIDPKMKSINQISPYFSDVIARKIKSDDRETALEIISRVRDAKTTLIASPKRDFKGFALNVGTNVAAEFVALGFKTLLLDITSRNYEGVTLSSYYANGEKAGSDARGFDILGEDKSFGWTELITRDNGIENLKAKYDKIVIAYQHDPQCGAQVLADVSDKLNIVINTETMHLKDIKLLSIDTQKKDLRSTALLCN